MAKKIKKVLYFIEGISASEADEEAMAKFDARRHVICVRNALMIHEGDSIESFDILAGAAPREYVAAAKEKGVEPEAPSPKTPAASVPPGSPVAPPEAPPPADPPQTPPEGEQQPPPPAGDGKPKTPAPKPDAGKGWKANA